MKYAPPIGQEAQGEDAHYIDGNPELGILGSPVPAAALEPVQRELVHVIRQAGLEPSGENLTQLWQAICRMTGNAILTCESAGAEPVKEVSLPGITPTPGARLNVMFAEVNCAFSPQLSVNGGTALPLLYDGAPPDVGDLAKNHIYTVAHTGAAWQIMAGMGRYRVGQFDWWQDTLLRPGLVPCNGCAIANASQYPQILAYLATPHGQARCFASLAAREAAHVAVWGSGTFKANWAGVGGLAKFFYDSANDTLYMPDLVGCFEAMAGDGNIAPSAGEVLGDQARPSTGWIKPHGNKGNFIHFEAGDSFFVGGSGRYTFFNPAGGLVEDSPDNAVFYNSGRAMPTGTANVPRSFGALLCAYLGQPTAAYATSGCPRYAQSTAPQERGTLAAPPGAPRAES